jgi:hypothetical protein
VSGRATPAAPAHTGRWGRLPERLRPRAEPGQSRRLWRIETLLLMLIGLVLAVATVNDLARQAHTNERLNADLRTWRHYTRHDYRNVSIDQETLGANSRREVLCGNTSPGPPGSKPQICLGVWGPTTHGLRTVHGGWYLPPYSEDLPSRRYGCFGQAGLHRCRR